MTYYEQLHQHTSDLHFEGKDYNGRKIIIDAAEISPDSFEVLAIRSNGDEVENRSAKTLENAKALFHEMVQFHTTGTAAGMYTREDWARDRTFSAKKGQEIAPEVFADMRDVLPPLPLPKKLKKQGFSGFLMGEPDSHNDSGPVHMAFVRANGHFYYYGKVNA